MGETLQIRNVDPLSGGRVEVSGPAPEAPSQGYTLVVRRGTTKDPFLGPKGWQQVEHAFVAQSSKIDGDRILLTFGSDVVDNALRDDDVVQISVPELSAEDVIVWAGITRSVTLTDDDRKPGPITPQEGSKKDADKDDSDDQTDKDDDEGEEQEVIIDPPGPTPPGPGGGGSSGRWLLLLIPLLIIGAVVAWMLLTPEEELAEEDQTPTEETVAEDDAAEAEETTEADATEEEAVEEEPVVEAEDATEEETAEPELSTYERGLAALKAGQCDDARSAILEAIAEGSGEAALLMAENQDSVDFESCMTETPNDIRALGNYSAACKAGVDGAKEKLEALEAALTARSDGGDVVASEVLRVAFPKAKEACSE